MNNLVRIADGRRAWDLLGDLDGLANGFLRSPVTMTHTGSNTRVPAIDVTEDDSNYLVKAEMPGMRSGELAVTVHDGVLAISAEHSKSEPTQKGRVIRQERCYGKFARSIRLGKDIDEERVTGDYRDGVLSLVIPKAVGLQPRKVDVKFT
jgi:HSP20 family molecular chaperone IbpA